MSVNSSNSSDISLHCYVSPPGIFIFTAFTVACVLCVPLHMLVLFTGYQRWRKQRSVSTAAMTSHSDIFTFNLVALDVITVVGSCLYSCGAFTYNETMIKVGMNLFSVTLTGQVLFNLLICAEQYLAVIHPITYWELRQTRGVRIRNVSIGCAWLLGFVSLLQNMYLNRSVNSVTSCCLIVFALIAVCFCSLSVLCVLIRPGPGEVGRDRELVDQTKRRAFYTITAIMTALLLRFLATLVNSMVFALELTHIQCVVGVSIIWLTLLSSLVSVLLFLHRAGKLPGCKQNTQSG